MLVADVAPNGVMDVIKTDYAETNLGAGLREGANELIAAVDATNVVTGVYWKNIQQLNPDKSAVFGTESVRQLDNNHSELVDVLFDRSEERRVGQECRSRRSPSP